MGFGICSRAHRQADHTAFLPRKRCSSTGGDSTSLEDGRSLAHDDDEELSPSQGAIPYGAGDDDDDLGEDGIFLLSGEVASPTRVRLSFRRRMSDSFRSLKRNLQKMSRERQGSKDLSRVSRRSERTHVALPDSDNDSDEDFDGIGGLHANDDQRQHQQLVLMRSQVQVDLPIELKRRRHPCLPVHKVRQWARSVRGVHGLEELDDQGHLAAPLPPHFVPLQGASCSFDLQSESF